MNQSLDLIICKRKKQTMYKNEVVYQLVTVIQNLIPASVKILKEKKKKITNDGF